MTTDVIDTSFHGTSFPTTYTGPGTIIGHPLSDGPDAGGQGVSGYFTSDGNATQILLGFQPTSVKIINSTDGITWEWQYGMPAANSVKTVLGGSLTSSQDTGSAITVQDGGPGTGGNSNVLLSTTLCGTGKNITYRIK